MSIKNITYKYCFKGITIWKSLFIMINLIIDNTIKEIVNDKVAPINPNRFVNIIENKILEIDAMMVDQNVQFVFY